MVRFYSFRGARIPNSSQRRANTKLAESSSKMFAHLFYPQQKTEQTTRLMKQQNKPLMAEQKAALAFNHCDYAQKALARRRHECPLCFTEIDMNVCHVIETGTNAQETACIHSCSTAMHAECIRRWHGLKDCESVAEAGRISCPMCQPPTPYRD